jgi:hypothetical protein
METLRMYKEMDVTYAELDMALLTFGYKKNINATRIFYEHTPSGSQVLVSPKAKPIDIVNKGWFVAYAYNMECMGAIEHRDDLAKLIEQKRLESLSSAN